MNIHAWEAFILIGVPAWPKFCGPCDVTSWARPRAGSPPPQQKNFERLELAYLPLRKTAMNVFARSARAAAASIRPALGKLHCSTCISAILWPVFVRTFVARTYATEAPAADKLRLTFVLPHKVSINPTTPKHHPCCNLTNATPLSFPLCKNNRPFTRPLMFSKSTWPPPLVTWVSLPTTSLPLSNWSLVSLKSLNLVMSPRSSSVKEHKAYASCRGSSQNRVI